jgi:ubiquinone/menaquinone biosynthesis C-methylase UbiE
MLNKGVITKEIKGINYIFENKKPIKYDSWVTDLMANRYEKIMIKKVFPKLFGSSYEKHNDILKKEYSDIYQKNVLELGTGSGNISFLLDNNNNYTGIDISPKLLMIAKKALLDNGFKYYNLYVSSADALPFEQCSYDICICNLSLNFFPEIHEVVAQIYSVLKSDGKFICSVPVIERNKLNNHTRGTQFTESRLNELFTSFGFKFSTLPYHNGALLYFSTQKL